MLNTLVVSASASITNMLGCIIKYTKADLYVRDRIISPSGLNLGLYRQLRKPTCHPYILELRGFQELFNFSTRLRSNAEHRPKNFWPTRFWRRASISRPWRRSSGLPRGNLGNRSSSKSAKPTRTDQPVFLPIESSSLFESMTFEVIHQVSSKLYVKDLRSWFFWYEKEPMQCQINISDVTLTESPC